jgi:hypothetical protein
MIIGKTPNLKQCSTMKQQRQTSPDNFGQIIVYSISSTAMHNEKLVKIVGGLTQQLANWASNID